MNDSPKPSDVSTSGQPEKRGAAGFQSSASTGLKTGVSLLGVASRSVLRTSLPAVIRPQPQLPKGATFDAGDNLYRSHTLSKRSIEENAQQKSSSLKPKKTNFAANLSAHLGEKEELKPLPHNERRKIQRKKKFARPEIVEIELS